MDPQSETPTAALPRLVRNLLAADPDLAAFFDRIAVADVPSYEMPLVTPSLLVYPGEPARERVVGGVVNLLYRMAVHVVLPRLTPALSDFTPPSAPTVTATATGPLTGVYEYRLTEFGAAGESYASGAAAVTVTAKAPAVSIPALTTGTGFRVWRSKAGKKACRWVGTVFGGSTSWADTTPDSHLGGELAPVLLLPERLTDAIAAALFAGEWLVEDGDVHADVCLALVSAPGSVVPVRNVWVGEIRPTIASYYNPETGAFLTETP